MVANPSVTRKTRIGISSRERGKRAPRSSATTPTSSAPPPMTCRISWSRPSHRGPSQPTSPNTTRPATTASSSTGVSRTRPIQIALGNRCRSSRGSRAARLPSGPGTVEERHRTLQLRQWLDAEPSNRQQVCEQACCMVLAMGRLPTLQLELAAPQPAGRLSSKEDEDGIEAEGSNGTVRIADRALGPALPKGELLAKRFSAGQVEEPAAGRRLG